VRGVTGEKASVRRGKEETERREGEENERKERDRVSKNRERETMVINEGKMGRKRMGWDQLWRVGQGFGGALCVLF
jgi:hypothetical protein